MSQAMSEIARKKTALEARVTAPGYQATERDVAQAFDLLQQYRDELTRMIDEPETNSKGTRKEPMSDAELDALADNLVERMHR